MAYRIACIYELASTGSTTVRLEVCNEGSTMQITPFVRKVGVAELLRDGNELARRFAMMLNGLGLEHQPFVLKEKEMAQAAVETLITENDYCFVQRSGSRTLKHGQVALEARELETRKGVLLGGTLYLTNPAEWRRGIAVRLRYEDALAELYPYGCDFPVATITRDFIKRDPAAENQLLRMLEQGEIDRQGNLTLPTCDVAYLKELAAHGWQVLFAKKGGRAAKVHFHHSKTGIDWFSTTEAEEADDDISGKLLEAYLHGRHYQEERGGVLFFAKDSVEKMDGDALTGGFFADSSLAERYKDIELSAEEEARMRERIENNFAATLHDYQWEGVRWIAMMRKKQCGCVLADEMGLGKTIQVLAHLVAVDDDHVLIVVPTSLVSNWQAEIIRFVPAWRDEVSLNCREPEEDKKIHIVSYELLRRNIAYYKSLHFDTLVLDEAQVLKNDYTQRHRVISQLDFGHGVVLTGTPIENVVDDVWSYFYILMPGMKALHDRLKRLADANTQTEAFLKLSARLLNPFILRRTKAEYLKELPACIEQNVYVTLSTEERMVYERVHKAFRKALKDGTSGRVNSIALEALLRLRQTCVSVNLLPKSLYRGGPRMSSKMQIALGYVQNLGKDDKIIIFSQFVQALEEMEGYLRELQIHYVSLYGATTDRKSPVENFQRHDEVKVFLSSIKAGGLGLNLTAADNVLLLDDWWNPAVEAQAFSRAHRMGQNRNVEVIRLVCKDTVEEKILALQERKQQTADVFNLAGGKLSKEELQELIG